MDIKLFRNGAELGYVTFNLIEREGAYADDVAVATVPMDATLEAEINTWLQSNPETLVLFGGVSYSDIGRYGDGVLAVLHTLGERHGFSFDRALIPMPTFPAGSVG